MKRIIKNYLPLVVCIFVIVNMFFTTIFSSTKALKIAISGSIMLLLIRTIPLVDCDKGFKHDLKEIIKTYGFILTELDDVPNLTHYTYYKMNSFNDILSKAMDYRVNIYIFVEDKTCDFVLINQNDLFIYTLKEDKRIFSKVDKYFIGVQQHL